MIWHRARWCLLQRNRQCCPRQVGVMTYRSGNVERASARPPIAAEVVALQRTSESGQERL
jgi:hypothetical protein